MKRLTLFLIPLILISIIVFGIIKIFILQDSGNGALQVTSQPLSKVYLDDTYLGNTPLCRCDASTMLKNGTYTLKVEPLDKNLTPYQEKISISKGVLTVVDRTFGTGATSEGSVISLTPLTEKNNTELLVISFPDKAKVLLDGAESGTTPLLIKNVTNSDHTLRLQQSGYKEKTIRIRTPVGYKLTATVYLGILTGDITPTPVSATPSASISATVTPKLSPTKSTTSGTVTILQTPNGFLRVRQQPSINAVEVARVTPGDKFKLVDEQDGWYQIELEDGTEGWVSGQYATKQ